MIKLKNIDEELWSKFLINQTNLELSITLANQRGETKQELIDRLMYDFKKFLNKSLEDK